jgi:putative endopeptidase
MKINIQWVFAAMFSCGFLLTACHDEIDDIDGDVPPPAPSGAENISEESAFNSTIDFNTYAGDDFYQYVVGKWIQDNPVPTEDDDDSVGLQEDQDENTLLALTDIIAQQKNLPGFSLLSTYDNDNLEADSTLLMAKLNQVDQVTTKEDMYLLMAQLINLGYPCPFVFSPEVIERNIYPSLSLIENYNLETKDLDRMGFKRDDAEAILTAGKEWKKYVEDLSKGSKVKISGYRYHPTKKVLIRKADTRGSGNSFIDAISNAVNVDLSAFASMEDYHKLLNAIVDYDLERLQALAKYFILNRDVKYMPFQKYDANTEEGMIGLIQYAVTASRDENNGLSTSLSHSYVQHSIPVEAKDEVTVMFENMRTIFRNRIDRNEWLSDATKSKAREKLDAMKILCGWPDNWHAEWEAKVPEGKTSYQMVCNLFAQYVDITRSIIGQSSEDAIFYASWMSTPAYLANAFYSLNNNYILMLASNLVKPIYDNSQQSFYNYAVLGTTIGHEMTHGFDSEGAKHDLMGKEHNWWTEQDLSKFKEKQQQLVEHFNKLEYMPGVYCNGEQTLAENIADLGGLEIAYETYMKTVTATGEERDFLGREFYRGYAEAWRYNMTPKAMESFLSDTHAPFKLRVNGNVNLIDEWYRLFNIESGKMYLSPDQRITIW